MSKRYIFLVFLLVAVIFALLLLPKLYYCSNDENPKLRLSANKCVNAGPKGLLLEAINTHRYIDADNLAAKIIGEDPSYALIDLRNEEQFNDFTFPRAINVPYGSILDESNLAKFDSDDYTYVLFSNGTMVADQAWLSLRKNGYENILVLQGGLNDFYNKVMNPVKPVVTDSKEVQELYNFRKAAGTYFGLPEPDEFIPEEAIEPVKKVYTPKKSTGTSKKKVVVKPKESAPVEEEEDEGC